MPKRTYSPRRSTFPPALALLALFLATLACARGTAPATVSPRLPLPVGQATATPPPLRGTPAAVSAPAADNAFASYRLPEEVETAASVPDYSLDLDLLENPEGLSALSAAQRRALAADGFVVSPKAASSFQELYRESGVQGLPLFITVDAGAHALDVVADVVQMRAETILAADLEALSQTLVNATITQWESAPDEETAAAARRNLVFFSVGYRLQNPAAEIPAAVAETVNDELTLIEEGGTFLSPLFGETRDYERFQTAGSDARDPVLTAYYNALIWYAYPFSLAGEDVAETRAVARQLLLITSALHTSQNYSRWQRIFHPLAYFWGTAGGWHVETVSVAAEALLGEVAETGAAADESKLDDFVATMRAFPHPDRFSFPTEPVFFFLPAPQLPDRSWLSSFVFNRVGEYTGPEENTPLTLVETSVGAVRGLPRVLDLAAAQGSAPALERLEGDGDTSYTGYVAQIDSARSRLVGLDPAAWTRTWAGGWHFGLRPLLMAPHPLPPIDTFAWESKAWNTWYGAWVRLQSGTVLAPRPVAPEVAPVARAGFVDPYPAAYARLAALTRQLHTGLDRYRLLEEEVGEKLLRLERLLLAFEAIARKELNGEALTEDQLLVLRQAGTRLEGLLTFAPPEGDNVPLTERGVARIVDVYASPGGDELLQAGVGGVWPIYVLVPAQERLLLTAGGVFGSYELRVNRSEKYEPERWPEVSAGIMPAGWTEVFLVP